jgi:hypothetical protein
MDDENTNDLNTDEQEDDTLGAAVDEDDDNDSNGGTASSLQPETGIDEGNLTGSGGDPSIPSPDNSSYR